MSKYFKICSFTENHTLNRGNSPEKCYSCLFRLTWFFFQGENQSVVLNLMLNWLVKWVFPHECNSCMSPPKDASCLWIGSSCFDYQELRGVFSVNFSLLVFATLTACWRHPVDIF